MVKTSSGKNVFLKVISQVCICTADVNEGKKMISFKAKPVTVTQEQYDVQEVVTAEEVIEDEEEEEEEVEASVLDEPEEILPDNIKIEECVVDDEANGIVEEQEEETFLTEDIFEDSGITREFENEDVFVNEVTIEDGKEETPVDVVQE